MKLPYKDSDFSARAIEAFKASGLPQTFKVASNTESTGVEIQVYDIIGTDETNATTFAAALESANGAPVTIRLSSPGGNCFEGWTMFNSLRNYAGPTTVVVDGVCASIASVIALGADTVQTAETSLWMVHNAWLLTVGNAADLRAQATTLDKIDGNLRAIYSAKTKTDPQMWADKMAAETWFTADEALAIGLVDAIAVPKKAEPSKAKASDSKTYAEIDAAEIICGISTVNEVRKRNHLGAIKAVFDPDQDGDDDAAEACGLINSAMVLLSEAIETMTATPDTADEDDSMQAQMAKALRLRRLEAVRRI